MIEHICPARNRSAADHIRVLIFQFHRPSGCILSGILSYGLLSECKRGVMRFSLAMFCLFACGTSALAQSGVSHQRDAYGNIIRDSGTYPARGVNRGPINNGQINNGPINSAPARSSTSNSRTNR
jgi:hypothetical protein